MKRLFDLHKQMHNYNIKMFQKQEKTMYQIQSQIKIIAENLENNGDGKDGKKKSESWWEVRLFVICI